MLKKLAFNFYRIHNSGMITENKNFTKFNTGLYIHFPWCIQKCPYCDFNSHTLKGKLPQEQYINRLIMEVDEMLPIWPKNREISSIFMGGGTPSLFQASYLGSLLEALNKRLTISRSCEITIEANPGSNPELKSLRQVGINRLSIGIQSFNNKHLKSLGRIHSSNHAVNTFLSARDAGFDNINIDIMFALIQQTSQELVDDLTKALSFKPDHLSWYQLTLEPNTLFHHNPPAIPDDETAEDMFLEGQKIISDAGYKQYEVSAYTKTKKCIHNVNYWSFGDYFGIGAGAHSKWTDGKTFRHLTIKHPKHYLMSQSATSKLYNVADEQKLFEYFLNRSRMPGHINLNQLSETSSRSVTSLREIFQSDDFKPFISFKTPNVLTLNKNVMQFNNNFMEKIIQQ